MAAVVRLLAVLAFALSGLACAGRAEPIEDPDLAPYQAAVDDEPPPLEPDEVIETPQVGQDLIGKEDDTAKGPTQHVEIEDEASPEDQVVAQPKRDKPGSFMSGIGMNPNK